MKEIALLPSFCPSFCLHCYTFSVALFCVAVSVAEFDRMMTIKTYGLAVTVYAYIQRKIVVSISLTTIYANFEGFFDDHFEVILKPLCGERGIRTPGTSRYGSFQDCCNRPLYHLS